MDYPQKQALPLIELTAEESDLPCSEARDGYHFIALTALERNKIPDVVSVKWRGASPQEIDNAITDSEIIEIIRQTPSSLLPTSQWRNIQAHDFNRMQSKVNELRETIQNHITEDECPANDEVDWWRYCKAKEPLLGSIIKAGQRTLEKLLEFQSKWLLEDLDWYMENHLWICPWIYCALVCLSIPLEADVVSSMRKITKTCYVLRKQMKPEQTDIVTPLNLIIRIVSINFRQHDLDDSSDT